MLLKLLQDGFGSAMDLNCAEKILYGANWAYNMKLPGEALKLAAGFGGGMGVESSCGVITGGVMVLSSLYVSRVTGMKAAVSKRWKRNLLKPLRRKWE